MKAEQLQRKVNAVVDAVNDLVECQANSSLSYGETADLVIREFVKQETSGNLAEFVAWFEAKDL
jgi:hypothetical protein